jgi:lysophospholipase L1-like esterase
MIDCLIIGDSIAVGTHTVRKECVAYATGGWNSKQWNKKYLNNNLSAKTVIISLGSNDHQFIQTRVELEKLRDKIDNSSKVYWIVPAIKENIQEIVKQIAKDNGDILIPITKLQTDGIHPSSAGYKEIAEKTKQP